MKLLVLLLLSTNVFSKNYEVQMLNKDGKETMLFKPSVLKIQVGDSVTFIPKNKGHNTQSVFTPEGSKPWKSENNEKIELKFDKEGVYIYECKNHGVMGMAGMIQVGAAKNLNEAKKFFKKFSQKFIMNEDRLKELLN